MWWWAPHPILPSLSPTTFTTHSTPRQAQQRRIQELERINVDLERRLEQQARERMKVRRLIWVWLVGLCVRSFVEAPIDTRRDTRRDSMGRC